jgi:hypothetical protein
LRQRLVPVALVSATVLPVVQLADLVDVLEADLAGGQRVGELWQQVEGARGPGLGFGGVPGEPAERLQPGLGGFVGVATCLQDHKAMGARPVAEHVAVPNVCLVEAAVAADPDGLGLIRLLASQSHCWVLPVGMGWWDWTTEACVPDVPRSRHADPTDAGQ